MAKIPFGPSPLRSRATWLRGAVFVRVLSIAVLPSLAVSGVALAGVNRWTTNGPGGGFVQSLAIDPTDPQIVYAGTSTGGAFNSLNGGESWRAINDGFVLNPSAYITGTDVRGIVVDPSSPATVYVAASWSGVFRSTNGGASWTPARAGLPTAVPVLSLAIDPSSPGTLYAGTGSAQAYGPGSGVFKSTDGGASWTPAGLSDVWVGTLLVDPSAPATIYARTKNGVFKSIDRAATWREVNAGLPAFRIGAIAIDPTRPTTLYAGSGYLDGLFKTIDGGGTWTLVGAAGSSFTALAVDPSTPSTLYGGTSSGVAKSTTGGASWVFFETGGPVGALLINPSASSTVLAGSGYQGGLVKTIDAGQSWKVVNAGLAAVSVTAVAPTGPNLVYAAGWGQGVFKSSDSGCNWNPATAGLPFPVGSLAVDPRSSATVYAGVSGSGVFKTVDGGATWTPVNNGLTQLWVSALAIDPSGTVFAGTRYPGGGFGYVFRSTDGGASWTQTGHSSAGVSSIAIDPSNPAILYTSNVASHIGGGGVRKSWDGGSSWGAPGLPDLSVASVAVDPSRSDIVYAGTAFYGIFKSSSGGASWTAINSGISGVPQLGISAIAIDPTHPMTLYVGTIGGVFKSVDGGDHWTALDEGLSNVSVKTLAIDPVVSGKIYAGTDGGGVFDYLSLEPCASGPTTLCLNGSRFSVTTRWTTRDGASGSGLAVALTQDTGYFTFFDPANVEVVVKILNGCGFNQRFWAFAGGLTDVNVVMTVTDHQTGAIRTYTNPQGTAFEPIQDTNAFASCGVGIFGETTNPSAAHSLLPDTISETFDTGGTAACSSDAATLCLSSRYAVRAQWSTRDGASGVGQAIPLTSDTGAFWFFSPSNVEVVIKVLNGCTFNSRRWTFAAGLTDVDVMLTVTDTQTGAIRTYFNPQGTRFQPIQDTDAFAGCP